MPNYLGIDKISQTEFGQIVAGVAKQVTGMDIKCSLASVQDWEGGRFQPNQIADRAIETIHEKTKNAKPKKKLVAVPWFVADRDENHIENIVQKITN